MDRQLGAADSVAASTFSEVVVDVQPSFNADVHSRLRHSRNSINSSASAADNKVGHLCYVLDFSLLLSPFLFFWPLKCMPFVSVSYKFLSFHFIGFLEFFFNIIKKELNSLFCV